MAGESHWWLAFAREIDQGRLRAAASVSPEDIRIVVFSLVASDWQSTPGKARYLSQTC